MCTQSKVCFAALFALSLVAYGNLNEIHDIDLLKRVESVQATIISHNSELYKRNVSDSAVGTYSACLNKNDKFKIEDTRKTHEIHSNIQKFSGTDNSTLYEALKDRLSEIETEEME